MADRTESNPQRVLEHVAAFNKAVTTADWGAFGERFALDATLAFPQLEIPPFIGRRAIIAAYEADPPTDTMAATGTTQTDDSDSVAFTWSRGGTGRMTIRWDGQLISALVVTFDHMA